MRTTTFTLIALVAVLSLDDRVVRADSRGDELAQWLNVRGEEVWGERPELCDDLTFARRVYLDVLGRIPSVSEVRDYLENPYDRRSSLVNQLVFAEGTRSELYQRLCAANFARHWQRVLLPSGTTTNRTSESVVQYLAEHYRNQTPFDELISEIVDIQTPQAAGSYYQLVGALPENYAGHVSRVALGIKIECAQCHDHPFNDWKQSDFWGMAAFYGDMSADSSAQRGTIQYEGTLYQAKLLWNPNEGEKSAKIFRKQLAEWMTSQENRYFTATAVNRFWQQFVGRGMYPDVENLDLASPAEREFLDEFGQRFAEDGFDIRRLVSAICKSEWYQASVVDGLQADSGGFERPLKAVSPDQVFDSLEQSLLLPISRIDPDAPRWTGTRTQLVSRLSETVGETPADYAAGIPQALMLMNGKVTSDAIDLNHSRLLRAVVESPFFDQRDRITTLYLAVLTREPTSEEIKTLASYLNSKPSGESQQRAYGEILWWLLNSPEFVLCR